MLGLFSVLQLAHQRTDSSNSKDGHSQHSSEHTPPHQHQHAHTVTSANGMTPHFTSSRAPYKRSAQFSIQRPDRMKMKSHSPRFHGDAARDLMARSKSNPNLIGMASSALSPYGSSCDFAAKILSLRSTLTLYALSSLHIPTSSINPPIRSINALPLCPQTITRTLPRNQWP